MTIWNMDLIFLAMHSLSMLKPLSAIIWEYIGTESKNFEWDTIAWSEQLPGYESDKKDTKELGVQPTSTLAVLWCLYSDHVNFCSSGLFGVSINQTFLLMCSFITD